MEKTHYLSQWAFTNRILKATKWAAMQEGDIQYMQMTSFGCGPDAFLIDEVRNLLKRYGKNLTLLKIDDVNNIGSIKLRVRSLVESLNFSLKHSQAKDPESICFNCSFHQERQKEENPRSILYAFHFTTHSIHHESGRI